LDFLSGLPTLNKTCTVLEGLLATAKTGAAVERLEHVPMTSGLACVEPKCGFIVRSNKAGVAKSNKHADNHGHRARFETIKMHVITGLDPSDGRGNTFIRVLNNVDVPRKPVLCAQDWKFSIQYEDADQYVASGGRMGICLGYLDVLLPTAQRRSLAAINVTGAVKHTSHARLSKQDKQLHLDLVRSFVVYLTNAGHALRGTNDVVREMLGCDRGQTSTEDSNLGPQVSKSNWFTPVHTVRTNMSNLKRAAIFMFMLTHVHSILETKVFDIQSN
jgi:hypothetical protein